MEQNYETVTTPPVDAASVLLLRDSDEGLQVLLMRRAQASQVLGGAYVFPGGKLDEEDHADLVLHCLSEPPETLRQRLGEPELPATRAAGLFMAALREAFEECGVLVGQDDGGTGDGGQVLAARLRAQAGGAGWHTLLVSAACRLRTEALLPWSRWITPRQPAVTNKRFDTRFFLAPIGDGQEARHDNFETTDSIWLTPLQALRRYASGEISLVAPQIMSLYELKAHRTVAAALAEARSRVPALIEPHPFDEGGQRVLSYPGDVGHPVRVRAMRGPTRLLFSGGRFVPVGGMSELLD